MRTGAPRAVAAALLVAALGPGLAFAAAADTPAPAPSSVPSVPAPDIALTPDAGQDARTIDLGDSRSAQTVTIRFVAPAKLAETPAPSVTDAQTSDGRPMDGTLTPSAELAQGNKTVIVSVKIAPKEDAEAGSYDTQVLLRATGVSDARSKLTIKLGDKPVCAANLWAVLLLLLGASLGLLARYVAGLASQLKAVEDRLAAVQAQVAGHQPLPAVFHAKLADVAAKIAADNAADAATTLTNDLEGVKTTAALDVAAKAGAIARAVSEQQVAIAAMPPDVTPAQRGELEQVLARARDAAEDLVNASDYAADGKPAERAALVNGVRGFSGFLAYYREAGRRDALADALAHFTAGEFTEANDAWRTAVSSPPPPAGALGVAAAGAMAAPAGGAGGGTSLKQLIIRHSPLIAQAFTALGLVILGLFTVYDPSTTFRGDAGFLDAVKLVAWGLGSALAGGGISDIAGKLTAGRSGTS
jgi:hypothetical protein